VTGIDRSVDRGGEDQAGAFLQRHEGLGPGGSIRRQAGAGDGDQPAAVRKARKRRADMAERCVRDPAIDMDTGREGRVHQHHAGPQPLLQKVVDMGGVVPADHGPSKQPGQQFGAGVGQFVEVQPGPGQGSEDSQKADSGRGLQHQVGGSDRRRRSGHKGQPGRG
jgi:hypothetical protein